MITSAKFSPSFSVLSVSSVALGSSYTICALYLACSKKFDVVILTIDSSSLSSQNFHHVVPSSVSTSSSLIFSNASRIVFDLITYSTPLKYFCCSSALPATSSALASASVSSSTISNPYADVSNDAIIVFKIDTDNDIPKCNSTIITNPIKQFPKLSFHLDFSLGLSASSPLIATYIITINIASNAISLIDIYTLDTTFLNTSTIGVVPSLLTVPESLKKSTLKNEIDPFRIVSGEIPILQYTNVSPNIASSIVESCLANTVDSTNTPPALKRVEVAIPATVAAPAVERAVPAETIVALTPKLSATSGAATTIRATAATATTANDAIIITIVNHVPVWFKSIVINDFSIPNSAFCNIEITPSAKYTTKFTIGFNNVPPISAASTGLDTENSNNIITARTKAIFTIVLFVPNILFISKFSFLCYIHL